VAANQHFHIFGILGGSMRQYLFEGMQFQGFQELKPPCS